MFSVNFPKRHFRAALPITTDNLVRLWVHRMLVKLGGVSRITGLFGFEDAIFSDYLDLRSCIDANGDPDKPAVRARLEAQLRELESRARSMELPPALEGNIAAIRKQVKLSAAAHRILGFVVLMHNVRELRYAANLMGELSSRELVQALAAILRLPPESVRSEISSGGALMTSGLVMVERGRPTEMPSKLLPIGGDFAERMMHEATGVHQLFSQSFFRSLPATLAGSDFVHLKAELRVLLPLLRQVRRRPPEGINILVYGAPGLGKTEFARFLAEDCNLELFEVASSDRDGDPIEAGTRLSGYRAALKLLKPSRSMIMFDEAEDVFGGGQDSIFAPPSIAQQHKAWVNHTLETNPVPTIWITNAVSGLDRAFIRRFTMVFEMPAPSARQLCNLVKKVVGDTLPAEVVAEVSDNKHATPAVLARAASVVQTISSCLSPEHRAGAFRMLVSGTLTAQGHKALPPKKTVSVSELYDPACSTADADLRQLARGLEGEKSGRICLFGPPGTGKTAFGQWLAGELDAPLHSHKISDILSAYLGESERNLANAFRRAAKEGAVLMLDEVDSFLQERKGARHRWEVTQVNEMLTQMEAFDGVFIASTNLMDNLDEAALRRFDLKIRFGYLQAAQSTELLGRYCRTLSIAQASPAQTGRLCASGNLTPGDFAAVARRHRFSPLATGDEFVEALMAEVRLKKDGGARPIGFLSAA